MNKIIAIISVFLLFSFNQGADKPDDSTNSGRSDSSLTGRIKGDDSLELNSGNIIWSNKPASEWEDGYRVGNGRLGGMVLGAVQHERISLNHDLLWRQFWSYQDHKTASDIKKIRELNLKGEWMVLNYYGDIGGAKFPIVVWPRKYYSPMSLIASEFTS